MAISLSNLPWYGQIGAFVVVCGAGVWGFHNFYANEKQAEIEALQGRVATLRNDIDRGVNTARRLPEFRAQVTELERKLDELKSVLPDQRDAQDLLRRVHTLATQSNLTIRSFSPRTSVKRALHEEWPIDMQLEGSYHDMGYFFDRIARFPRIINIGDLEIRAQANQTAGSTITARVTATTFVLVEQPKTAAPGQPVQAVGLPPPGGAR